MKKIIKKNYKMLIGFVLGMIVSGIGVYATTSIGSSQVSYDNRTSGMSATTMQQALDELYSKVPKKNQNFKMAYQYNETCITGEESSCLKTECYKTKSANSCKSGDIIDYQVNDDETIRFHVMYDKGDTMVLQMQKDTVTGIQYGPSGGDDIGPTIAIEALESATNSWINVEDQPYIMGETPFVGANYYTECNNNGICSKNIYTWKKRTAKARMITVQEANDLGCNGSGTCPKWMSLYSKVGSSSSSPDGYFTMNLDSAHDFGANMYIFITSGRSLTTLYGGIPSNSARAVVVVSK